MLSKDCLIPADGKTEKYLFDAINCYDEVYATDNFFSNVKAWSGSTYAQIYCGNKFSFAHVFGMKTESEMPDKLMDSIHMLSSMKWLFSNNSKVQNGSAVEYILWQYNIGDSYGSHLSTERSVKLPLSALGTTSN